MFKNFGFPLTLLVALFWLRVTCVPEKTIVFVHSYRSGMRYADDEDKGVVQGLAEEGWFEGRTVTIHRKYMYTKTKNIDDSSKSTVTSEIESEISTIHQVTPVELLVLFNDDAFQRFGLKDREQKVLFIGINGMPEYYNETNYMFIDKEGGRKTPGHNISGVFEKMFTYESLRMMKYLFPKTLEGKVVRCFFENSTAGFLIAYHVRNMKEKIFYSHNISIEVFQLDYFSEYENHLKDIISNNSIGGVFLILHRLKDDNNPSITITSKYTIPYTTERLTNKPDLASSAPNSLFTGGLLGGIGTYVKGMGELCGRYAARVLSGEKIGDLPILNSPPTVFFNLDRFKQLGKQKSSYTDLIAYAGDETFETPPSAPVEEKNAAEYDPTALIVSLSTLTFVWILSSICCCVLVSCVLLLMSVLGCAICDACGIVFCQFLRARKQIKDLDVDEIMARRRRLISIAGKGQSISEKKIQEIMDTTQFNIIEYKTIKLMDVIGTGGQDSTIFKAKWKKKLVAYKKYDSLGNRLVYDFQMEAAILSKLNHPNILEIFGCVCDEGKGGGVPRYGIVMEFCQRGDLHDYVEKHKLLEYNISWDERMKYLREICLGMEYLHARKIIHRDLKMKNVMLKNDGHVRIIDFGLSKVTSHKIEIHTVRIGTPAFMAPEVIVGEDYDRKVDVYSFAIIMYCMMTLEVDPYKGVSSNSSDSRYIETKVSNDPTFRPKIPSNRMDYDVDWFIELMQLCWDHRPQRRLDFKMIRDHLEKASKEQMGNLRKVETEMNVYSEGSINPVDVSGPGGEEEEGEDDDVSQPKKRNTDVIKQTEIEIMEDDSDEDEED